MDLLEKRAQLEIQQGKLAASLGLTANQYVELAPMNEVIVPNGKQTEGLIDLAWERRTDLLAKRANLNAAIAREKQARSGYYPSLSLGGRGGANHAFNDKADAAQYEVRLNLDIPLFGGFDTMYQNRMAYADRQMNEEALSELQLDIALEVLTYSQTLKAAQEMLSEAHELFVNSQKAYESALSRYQSGKERISEVSTALRQLASSRVRLSDIKTRYFVSMANLAYAVGTLEVPCEK
jgi:outer membrane protein